MYSPGMSKGAFVAPDNFVYDSDRVLKSDVSARKKPVTVIHDTKHSILWTTSYTREFEKE